MLEFFCHNKLSTNQKIIYLYLLEKAKNNSGAISLKGIGKELNLAKSTVNLCLTALEEQGAISIENQFNEFGGTTYNKYIIYKFKNDEFTNEIEAIL